MQLGYTDLAPRESFSDPTPQPVLYSSFLSPVIYSIISSLSLALCVFCTLRYSFVIFDFSDSLASLQTDMADIALLRLATRTAYVRTVKEAQSFFLRARRRFSSTPRRKAVSLGPQSADVQFAQNYCSDLVRYVSCTLCQSPVLPSWCLRTNPSTAASTTRHLIHCPISSNRI